MNHFKACYAIALALCLVLTCGVLAYAEVASQNVKSEEPAEAVIEEMIEDEEYTESKVVFTDDDMLILPRPVKEGKIFVEWNTKEDGTGQGYNAGEIVDPENIELYAIWADEDTSKEEPVVSDATDSEAAYDEEPQKEIIETEDKNIQNGETEE